MTCEFDLCIYNHNDCCSLKEIEIDEVGMCESCITISLPDKLLELIKKEQIKEMEDRYKRDGSFE